MEVAQLIDSFEPTLGAATPVSLDADPYLTTTLWAAVFRAEKALRYDNDAAQTGIATAPSPYRRRA